MTSESTAQGAAKETVFDVDVEKLAGVYAQAGLDAAGDGQDALVEELEAIVAEVLDPFADLEEVFGSALVATEDKLEMLDRIFGSRLSDVALRFLKVITQHGRLGLLRQIVRSAGELAKQRNNQVSVELQLACELGEDLQREVIDTLCRTLDIHAVVTTKINPELIAGFVVRVGDRVYDASARTSFEQARQTMIERAVEAIQSRPERFRSEE